MCAKLIQVFAIIAVASVAAVFAESPTIKEPCAGPFLDPYLVSVRSVRDIEDNIKASLRFKYSEDIIAEGYKIYEATNNGGKWVFVAAGNAPRGMDVINLYCYKEIRPDRWMLQGYRPLYGNHFAWSADRGLRIEPKGDHINVLYRDTVVYTTPMGK